MEKGSSGYPFELIGTGLKEINARKNQSLLEFSTVK